MNPWGRHTYRLSCFERGNGIFGELTVYDATERQLPSHQTQTEISSLGEGW